MEEMLWILRYEDSHLQGLAASVLVHGLFSLISVLASLPQQGQAGSRDKWGEKGDLHRVLPPNLPTGWVVVRRVMPSCVKRLILAHNSPLKHSRGRTVPSTPRPSLRESCRIGSGEIAQQAGPTLSAVLCCRPIAKRDLSCNG